MKAYLPNFITLLNLLCGSSAIIAFVNGENLTGIFLILAGLAFDFLDGFTAKLLDVKSDIGKELDSLADLITFGLVPGMIVYLCLTKSLTINSYDWNKQVLFTVPYIGFIITAFSALRLAKFNLDTRQSNSFIGLPTPANTLFFLTIPLNATFGQENSTITKIIENPYLLIGITILFSYLLVSEIPMLAFKFKNYTWKENKEKYVLLISSLILLWKFNFLATPFIIFLYLIISIIHDKTKTTK